MKWYRKSLLIVAALALVAGCAPPESTDMADEAPMVDVAAFEASLNALQDAYIAAYNGGDAAGIAALFAADGRLSPPMSPALDVAGIEATYAASFAAGIPMVLEVMREDFLLTDGMAVAWGTFEVTATPPEGESFVTSGRYGSVMRMDPDGTWKLFRHMYNYEVPPPGFGQEM